MATEGASVMVSVAKCQQDPSLAVLVRGSLIVDPRPTSLAMAFISHVYASRCPIIVQRSILEINFYR